MTQQEEAEEECDDHIPHAGKLLAELHTHEGEHHLDLGSNVPITWSMVLFALCASVNSCNLGYDIGVSTEAARLIQNDMGLSEIQRELFTGCINFWASTCEYIDDFFFFLGNVRTTT